MGKVAKEIAHTRTPLNNCEPIVIIMHIIGKKNRKKKKKTEKRKKKGKRKKEKKIYIYIINKKGKNEKERCQWKVLKAKGAKSGK